MGTLKGQELCPGPPAGRDPPSATQRNGVGREGMPAEETHTGDTWGKASWLCHSSRIAFPSPMGIKPTPSPRDQDPAFHTPLPGKNASRGVGTGHLLPASATCSPFWARPSFPACPRCATLLRNVQSQPAWPSSTPQGALGPRCVRFVGALTRLHGSWLWRGEGDWRRTQAGGAPLRQEDSAGSLQRSLGRGDSCDSGWDQRGPCLSGRLWKCCVCAHEYMYLTHVHSPRPGPDPGALPVSPHRMCVRMSTCTHVRRCARMSRYVSECVRECIMCAHELCACVSEHCQCVHLCVK